LSSSLASSFNNNGMDAVIPLLLVLDAVQMAWVTILFQYVPGMQSNVHLDLSPHRQPDFPPVVVKASTLYRHQIPSFSV
jgi:hypothetical protein